MLMIPDLILLGYCRNVEWFYQLLKVNLVSLPLNFTLQAFPILLGWITRFKLALMIFFKPFRKTDRAFHSRCDIMEGDLSRGIA